LKVEALEDRTLMTGNVSVFLDIGGTLHVTGDGGGLSPAFPEAVQVLDSSPPGLPNLTFRVQGAPGTFTSVNGVQFIDFVGSSIQSVIANFPSFGPATFNRLDIIGQFPAAPTSGTNFPGSVTVTSGTGSTSLTISNLTTNSVSLFGAANTASDTVSLTNVKVGQVLAFTGSGGDTYNFAGDNIAIAQLTTDAGNDRVTIAGSTVGSLTATSTTGNDTYNITGNSLSKSTVNIGTGAGTGADTVTFTNNTILSSAALTIGTGGTAGPTGGSGGSTVGTHQINISGNVVTLGDLTAKVGNSARTTGNNNGVRWDQTNVTFNNNRTGGNASLTVGNNAQNVLANGNAAAKNMIVNIGDGANFVLNGNGGSPAPPAIGVSQVNGNTVGGQLAIQDGLPLAGSNPGQIHNLQVDSDRSGTLFINVLSAPNNTNFQPETISITNDVLTTATPAANIINIAQGLGGVSRNTTVSNLFSPTAPVQINISATALGAPTGNSQLDGNGVGGNIVVDRVVSDELEVAVGNLFSNVSLTNDQTAPDANGAGNMFLTMGTSNGATGLNVTVNNINVGNAAAGLLELDKVDTPTDQTVWTVSNVVTFDWNMAAGDGTGGINIATLSSIKVTDFMQVQFGNGFNGVQATNLVVSPGFGFINGGGNPGSVYVGSPTNFGFVVFGFGAYF
jgi:hypothetical protein